MACDVRPPRRMAWGWVLAAVGAVSGGGGCGRVEPTARLTGTVVVGGHPPTTPLMVVAECAAKGISAAAPVDAAGRFEVFTAPGRGVPEGTYAVAVIAPPRPLGDIADGIGPARLPLAPSMAIPSRFNSPRTSGLTVDVRLPETRFDVEVPKE
jgi:hypothetical protein